MRRLAQVSRSERMIRGELKELVEPVSERRIRGELKVVGMLPRDRCRARMAAAKDSGEN